MTEALKFVPPRVPLTDPLSGFITREWYLFLQGVFIRIGGATGASTSDLSASMFEDAGVEETKATLFRATQDSGQVPPTLPALPVDDPLLPAAFPGIAADDPLLATVLALRDQVAELTKEIQGLRQGSLI